MMVSHMLQSISSVYASNRTSATAPKVRAMEDSQSPSDEIILSKEAKNFSSILQDVKGMMDDVRWDKVNFLAAQISAGQYAPSAENLATAMLQNRF